MKQTGRLQRSWKITRPFSQIATDRPGVRNLSGRQVWTLSTVTDYFGEMMPGDRLELVDQATLLTWVSGEILGVGVGHVSDIPPCSLDSLIISIAHDVKFDNYRGVIEYYRDVLNMHLEPDTIISFLKLRVEHAEVPPFIIKQS